MYQHTMSSRGILGLGWDGGQLEVNGPLPDYRPYCMWVQPAVNAIFMSLFRSGLCFSKVSILLLIYYTRGTDVLPYYIITLCFLPLRTVWGKWLYFALTLTWHKVLPAKWNNWGRASVVLVYGQWWQAGLLRSVLQVNTILGEVALQQRVQREREINKYEWKKVLTCTNCDCWLFKLELQYFAYCRIWCNYMYSSSVCVWRSVFFLLAAHTFIMTVSCSYWQYATGLTRNAKTKTRMNVPSFWEEKINRFMD